MPAEPSIPALRSIVADAVRAPSSHNTQPWLFRLGADTIEVHADRCRALPVNDPDDRELTISCGAALFNLRVAAAHAGFAAKAVVLPDAGDPDLLATVTLTADPDTAAERPAGADLHEAIAVRRTCRGAFEERPVPDNLVAGLFDAALAEGAALTLMDGPAREALVELVGEGDRMQFANRHWRRELAMWMHPRRAGDGLTMPAASLPVARMVVTAFDLGRSTALKDQRLAEATPVLAVLTTTRDTPDQWMLAGQALQRLLLTAAAAGVHAAYLNQPCQVAELRPRVEALLDPPASPQLILRLGFPTSVPDPSPRRRLESVLL